MGVCEEVIEHITDDAYNRQGGYRAKWLIYCRKKKYKTIGKRTRQNQPTGGRSRSDFYGVLKYVNLVSVFVFNVTFTTNS